MPYPKIVYFSLFGLVFCGGCGLTERIVQKEPKSYLWFTGNTEKAIVFVDDLKPIELDGRRSVATDDNENIKATPDKVYYEISSGKHKIIVIKLGREVVNRNVLLGNDVVKEINIP